MKPPLKVIKGGRVHRYTHGQSAYLHGGCRCEVCRAGHARALIRYQESVQHAPAVVAREPVNLIRTWSDLRSFRLRKNLPHFVP